MKKNYTLFVAKLNTTILYIDIVFKIILSFFDKASIYIDYFWFGTLLVICALGWLLHFKGSRGLETISYAISWAPTIIFLSYWITLGMTSFEGETWRFIMTYMVSEIMLFIPTYVLATMDLKDLY